MNLQAFLADIDKMLGWIPSWSIGLSLIAGAIFLALVVYRLAAWLLNRAFGTRLPLMSVFIERTAGPAQLALCLAAVALVLPLAPLDDTIRTPLMRVFVVAFIALIGWISIRIVDMSAARYLQNFRDVSENFVARKHVTQVRVFKRVTDTIIVVITVSTALMTFDSVQAIRRQPVRLGRSRRYHRRSCRAAAAEQSHCRRADRDHPADPHRGCRDHRERVGLGRGHRRDLCRDPAVGLAPHGGAAVLLHRKAVPELDPRHRVPDRRDSRSMSIIAPTCRASGAGWRRR